MKYMIYVWKFTPQSPYNQPPAISELTFKLRYVLQEKTWKNECVLGHRCWVQAFCFLYTFKLYTATIYFHVTIASEVFMQ